MITNWSDLKFFSTQFHKTMEFVNNERKLGQIILPNNNEILKALELTPFDEVKVVILGQDPYPTADPKHAMGLSFSVPPTLKTLPKSLINIYQELYDDIGVKRTNGCLVDWAEQGVLLLNTSLTVKAGQPGSHSNIGWEILTNEIIKALNEFRSSIVFVLWGKFAELKARLIDENRHFIIISAHPSPLSAYRGFFGSKPFSRTNQFLGSTNQALINW